MKKLIYKTLRIFLMFFAIVVVILLIISVVTYLNIRNSPFQTLLDINQSLENKDYKAFEKLVDIDSLSGDIASLAIQSGFGDRGGSLQEGGSKLLKPLLKEIIQKEIEGWVASGQLNDLISSGDTSNFLSLVSGEGGKIKQEDKNINNIDFMTILKVYIYSDQRCVDKMCNSIDLLIILDNRTIILRFDKDDNSKNNDFWKLVGIRV